MARRAVQVGINNYKSIGDLNGCLNDVTNVRGILKGLLGFTNEEIRVLTDDRATKANILDRLNWLVKGAKSGDYLVFHYSGHGSQIRDRQGDELSDSLDVPTSPMMISTRFLPLFRQVSCSRSIWTRAIRVPG